MSGMEARKKRESLHISREKMAQEIEVCSTTIRNWELSDAPKLLHYYFQCKEK